MLMNYEICGHFSYLVHGLCCALLTYLSKLLLKHERSYLNIYGEWFSRTSTRMFSRTSTTNCILHWAQLLKFDFPLLLIFIRWEKPGHSPSFGYDFWYQPRHDVMISSSWGAPAAFTKGFNLQHVADGLYGKHLYVYSWSNGELKQTLDLGDSGLLPLEVCFPNIMHRCYAFWLWNSKCYNFFLLFTHYYDHLHFMV